MGKKNSSKTRVDPVFRSLYKKDEADTPWLPRLLKLPIGGHAIDLPPKTDFTIKEMYWGANEKKLQPPLALLSWLIRHPREPSNGSLSKDPVKARKRKEWIGGSQDRILEGLRLLRNNPKGEDWHLFEGKTQPDVFIETPHLLIVIEGKRTEREPTTSTKWMPVRHQMLRHLDGAWEIAAGMSVIGFFIVEGEGAGGEVPKKWVKYAKDTISETAIRSSLPHRGPEEQCSIASAFAGVTTWQRVCEEFGIPWESLSDEANK
jgi:hypothetical protein